ncbi:MAG TPA: ABC-type transport auxiliary lipoprotein family protein [Kofleriaceae bacterium]|jgi:ABC-type uncharacterized transport system auxiliary subunit|nr:ABC-type transport auxiliary lipoprotein family protein [Kofleriaceae bacterium]
MIITGVRARRGAVALIAALLGCAGAPPPEVVYYDLVGPGERTAPAAGGRGVLVIERFDAAAPYDGDALTLRTAPLRLETYHYHRLASSVPDQVSELLAAEWRGSGRFAHVEVDGGSIDAGLSVGGRIVVFEELALPGETPVAHVVVAITARTVTGDVVLRQTFERRETMPGRDAGALVEAFRSALRAIAAEALPALETALRQAAADDAELGDR